MNSLCLFTYQQNKKIRNSSCYSTRISMHFQPSLFAHLSFSNIGLIMLSSNLHVHSSAVNTNVLSFLNSEKRNKEPRENNKQHSRQRSVQLLSSSPPPGLISVSRSKVALLSTAHSQVERHVATQHSFRLRHGLSYVVSQCSDDQNLPHQWRSRGYERKQ